MTISEWALREGIVLDVIGRHDPVDWSDDPRAIRRASVQAPRASMPLARGALASRRRARASSSSTRPRSCTGSVADDRELLEFGAFLHDIGEHVAQPGSPQARRVPRAARAAARLHARRGAAPRRAWRGGTVAASRRRPTSSRSSTRTGSVRSSRCCGSPTGSTAAAPVPSSTSTCGSGRHSSSSTSRPAATPSSSCGARGASASSSRRSSGATSSWSSRQDRDAHRRARRTRRGHGAGHHLVDDARRRLDEIGASAPRAARGRRGTRPCAPSSRRARSRPRAA